MAVSFAIAARASRFAAATARGSLRVHDHIIGGGEGRCLCLNLVERVSCGAGAAVAVDATVAGIAAGIGGVAHFVCSGKDRMESVVCEMQGLLALSQSMLDCERSFWFLDFVWEDVYSGDGKTLFTRTRGNSIYTFAAS